jgi:hypothetical protein
MSWIIIDISTVGQIPRSSARRSSTLVLLVVDSWVRSSHSNITRRHITTAATALIYRCTIHSMSYQAVGVLNSSISISSSSTKLGTSTSSSSSKPTKQPHHYKYDLFRFYENMPVESPVRDGLIVNWDMLEDLWEHCLISYLRLNHNSSPLNLSEFPMLFTEKHYRECSYR